MKWQPSLAVTIATALIVACASPQVADDQPTEQPEQAEQPDPVEVRILGANDFHGALEGPDGTVPVDGEDVDAGGAAYLAAHADRLRADVDHSTFVHAGDLIGASPLISALFYDEPTIEVMNAMGLDIAGVGNHEFDQGVDEFLRIVEGGCHEEEGCREDHTYEGAEFDFLAANVRWRYDNETILDPYTIREYDGIQIAYVGMTLEDTPSVVVPSAIEDVTFENEVESVEKLMPEFDEKGVDSVVVVVHEGGHHEEEFDDIGDCADVQGPIVDIAEGMPEEVEVIVSGHTHVPYICEFGDTLVTQAAHSGRVLTAIDLTFDADTGELTERSAEQHPVTDDIESVGSVASIVDEYGVLAEKEAQRVIGEITEELDRGERRGAGESPIGRLIADAQLAATDSEAGADVAFMNPGGIRAPLEYDEETGGAVTFEQLHTIQPFNNTLVTMTLTGEQIHKLLEQQWREDDRNHQLAVSAGFTYRWDPDADYGERVDFDSIKSFGEPLDKESEYRVTVNNFLADGGDGFTILKEGTDRTVGIVDLDALAEYVERYSPVRPPDQQRVKKVE